MSFPDSSIRSRMGKLAFKKKKGKKKAQRRAVNSTTKRKRNKRGASVLVMCLCRSLLVPGLTVARLC
jgi:hypothetical protein